jgi:hypothetical protein
MAGGAKVLLLLALVLAFAAPGAALAASSNASSTHTVIVAGATFVRESEGHMGAIGKAVQAQKRSLLHQCSDAAANSPQNEESYELSYEAAGALWSAGYGADAGPIAKFVQATRGLHWTNAKLNSAFKGLVDGLHGLSTLAMPHVCKDIASWKASGFVTVPAVTKSFDVRVEALEAKPLPARLLDPYVQSGQERALIAQIERGSTKLLNFETQVGGEAWYALTEGLDLNP